MTSDANNLPPDRRGPRRFRRRSEPTRGPRQDASSSPDDAAAAGETGPWQQEDEAEDVEQETLNIEEEAALDYETTPEDADLGPFDDEAPAAPELPAFDRVPREPPRVAEFGPLTDLGLQAPIDETPPAPPPRDRDALARDRAARARDAYTYEDERLGPGIDIEAGELIRNPYVLAGLAVAGAIVLAVIVVILFGGGGGGGGGNGGDNGVIINPLTPGASKGVAAKSIAISTVREGPGQDYTALGTLNSGQNVQVIGRNADTTWYQIYYSGLPGWVPSSALKLSSNDSASLPIASVTPISRPTVIQPTLPPEATETVGPTATATVAATPPDLRIVFASNNCGVGQPINMLIANVGQSPITKRQITIDVSGGATETLNFQIDNLPPGQSQPFATTTNVQRNQSVTVRLILVGTPAETNTANNSAICNPASGGGNPTPGGTNVPPTIAP